MMPQVMATVDPIWWFRGGAAMFIDNFHVLNKDESSYKRHDYIIEKVAVKKREVIL